jgi:hypothetical protein
MIHKNSQEVEVIKEMSRDRLFAIHFTHYIKNNFMRNQSSSSILEGTEGGVLHLEESYLA